MRLLAEQLTVRYPGRATVRPALEGVDLRVEPGTLYAVLGPNGSGKSTLMRALLGSVALSHGSVRLGDRPLADWSRNELARWIGVVTQHEPLAFPLRVSELVAMGRYPHLGPFRAESEADRAIVDESLRRCDALELVDREVGTLSGGEHQRVRIARALAQEPRALLLDEPTASLDIRHEMEILKRLRAEADEGRTVLLITHHLDLAARFADEILLLDRGQVAAQGKAEEVFTAEILERVYGWPVEVRTDEVTGSPRVIPKD
jgi:iron complex transport system ATP-binding protein